VPDGDGKGGVSRGAPGQVATQEGRTRDGTAGDDAAEAVHLGEQLVEDLAADVVKVDVDAALGRLGEVGLERGRLVVEARIGPEALDKVTLLLASSDADHPLAADDVLGELDGDRARRAGRGRDDDRVLLLDLADKVQAAVGGDARQAEERERDRRRLALDRLDVVEALGGSDEVAGPAVEALGPVAS
jgi:hypothetical protein